jgi:hypothetical protein
VRIIYLPYGPDGSKTGLDDFLAAGHSRDDLLALASDVLRPLPSDAPAPTLPDVPLLSTGELAPMIETVLDRYLRLPSRAAVLAIALWVMHTWAFDGAYATPYLVVQSPAKRSGKTRLEETLELVVRSPWRIAAASESALFRKIADQRPTLLLDECDATFAASENEPLRAILNAGNRPGASVARTVGEGSNQTVADFEVYCPKVLAGIASSKWPDTVLDRSIRIPLQRKKQDEAVARLRYRQAHAETEELRDALAVWADAHVEILAGAEPDPPPELDDRAAEGWEALLAIADTASAELADRARKAAVELARRAPADDDGQGVLLLRALKPMFAEVEVLSTKDIVSQLNEDEELPFGGDRQGAGMDGRGLARLLKPFRVRPDTVRIGTQTPKGYRREWFEDAWESYCPPNAPPGDFSSATSATSAPESQISAVSDPQQKPNVADSKRVSNPHGNADVADVADRNRQPGADGDSGTSSECQPGSLVEQAEREYGGEK